jgi:hypothetical protein
MAAGVVADEDGPETGDHPAGLERLDAYGEISADV